MRLKPAFAPMAAYRLTRKAGDDLDGIYEYTIETFGLGQARNYLNGLLQCFEYLGEYPQAGPRAARFAPCLRRYPFRSHIVFYMPQNGGVLVVRVLHERMDAARHFVG